MHSGPSHGNGVGRFNRNNNPYGGFGYNTLGGWGAGVGGLFGFELNGNENQIPFYALHPPVYYSYPIARPYGDTPFAYLPGWSAGAASDCGPQMIINPDALPGNPSPSGETPTPPSPSITNPAPANPAPKNVKPTAGHTASLVETDAAPSVESLPSPGSDRDPRPGRRCREQSPCGRQSIREMSGPTNCHSAGGSLVPPWIRRKCRSRTSAGSWRSLARNCSRQQHALKSKSYRWSKACCCARRSLAVKEAASFKVCRGVLFLRWDRSWNARILSVH